MRTQHLLSRTGLAFAGALLLAIGACRDNPTEPPDTGEIRLSVVAAATSFVSCGQEIPVSATVTDARGKGVSGFHLNFNVLEGGGRMFGGAALTDNKGIARDIWTIGSSANLSNTIAVRAVNSTGVGTTYFTQTVTTRSRIAFASSRDGNLEIYTMNPDGTGLVRLTTNTSNDDMPSWSGCVAP
jgi:hypothetical protein